METNKKSVRKIKLNQRNLLSGDAILNYSNLIYEKVIDMDEYKEAESILIYASFGSEVITGRIISHALKENKRVYLPKVKGDNMDFYQITSVDELSEGAWGIPEPKEDVSRLFYEDKDAPVFMPLVAYDINGNRIGYGKGYYDRFLAGHITGKKIGLAFKEQEAVFECDKTDYKMDIIVTQDGVSEVKHDRF